MENQKLDPRTAFILKNIITFLLLCAFIFGSILIVNFVKSKNDAKKLEQRYQLACTQFDENRYSDALSNFNEVLAGRNSYKDAVEKKDFCMKTLYEQAVNYAFIGDLQNAELIFMTLPSTYENTADIQDKIATNKKFGGTWKCTSEDIYLKTSVYVDYDSTPKIRAEISDLGTVIFDDPITLSGADIEINTDRFSWAIYDDQKYSFVYTQNSYTMLRQPVTAGSKKYVFERIYESDYNAAIAESLALDPQTR